MRKINNKTFQFYHRWFYVSEICFFLCISYVEKIRLSFYWEAKTSVYEREQNWTQIFILYKIDVLREGRNIENQNVESIFRMIRMSKDQNVKNQNVKNQNVKNQNVEKNVKSLKMTFDILIFFDAIGNIRTSKVF